MSSPALDLADNWTFTELWIDPTAVPPYVLILLCDDRGSCCIYDPAQNYQVVFESSSYSEAKLWLLEDKYERVEGQLRAEKVA
ncbi:MAG: hypothetical protein HC840_19395 [Leptolyngbyaceae cyanobacterium RM2_2_4]|nr:hypothetical protein [Leptolyngbyaceae cyanobacterium SM1_4_3]NJN91174.1 hypothetical protein [Leptolyngbyaceae cyanobacterium SL_5_14]NJO51247.1 hypothetical protein [Leptolyngbyaceae cyanobacterium RM2_2_4]NJO75605.1 hypothetical protein [Leptolyngbyaceae cyanobacterium RM1_406_9]